MKKQRCYTHVLTTYIQNNTPPSLPHSNKNLAITTKLDTMKIRHKLYCLVIDIIALFVNIITFYLQRFIH